MSRCIGYESNFKTKAVSANLAYGTKQASPLRSVKSLIINGTRPVNVSFILNKRVTISCCNSVHRLCPIRNDLLKPIPKGYRQTQHCRPFKIASISSEASKSNISAADVSSSPLTPILASASAVSPCPSPLVSVPPPSPASAPPLSAPAPSSPPSPLPSSSHPKAATSNGSKGLFSYPPSERIQIRESWKLLMLWSSMFKARANATADVLLPGEVGSSSHGSTMSSHAIGSTSLMSSSSSPSPSSSSSSPNTFTISSWPSGGWKGVGGGGGGSPTKSTLATADSSSTPPTTRIVVFGGGSFGTAMATALAMKDPRVLNHSPCMSYNNISNTSSSSTEDAVLMSNGKTKLNGIVINGSFEKKPKKIYVGRHPMASKVSKSSSNSNNNSNNSNINSNNGSHRNNNNNNPFSTTSSLSIPVISLASPPLALSLAAPPAPPLATRLFEVTMLVRDPKLCDDINHRHCNSRYLKDFTLPPNIRATTDPREALRGAHFAVHAIPVQTSRSFLRSIKEVLPSNLPIICVSKGLEAGTGQTMSEVLATALDSRQPTAFLSGPSFAKEVMQGRPTGVVAASRDPKLARTVQALFASPILRVNTTTDVIGVEICGALKNVLAIAAGIVQGLDLGHNSMATLISQGCSEIRWLSQRLGARATTMSGLSGLGDIMLTCYGDLSRNRSVGVRLGRGEKLEEILASSQVAEGVATAGVVVGLARRYNVTLPVLTAVAQVLCGNLSPKEAVDAIMGLPQVEEK